MTTSPVMTGSPSSTPLHTVSPVVPHLIMASKPRPATCVRRSRPTRRASCCKDTSPENIGAAIRQVAKGMKALDPDLAFATLDAPVNPMTHESATCCG